MQFKKVPLIRPYSQFSLTKVRPRPMTAGPKRIPEHMEFFLAFLER